MGRAGVWAGGLLLAGLCGSAPLAGQASSDTAAAIARIALPIRSTSPRTADADLLPLLALLRDRRVVAMGEATHGTAEFFSLKHRVLALLVERAGTRIFALEDSPAAVRAAEEYVVRGKGSARAAVRTLMWPWQSDEMVALLEWARRWNAGRPERDRIRIRGIDAAQPDRDLHMAHNVLALLRAEGPPGPVFLWAHNGHVRTAPHAMGGELRRVLGEGYYAIGFEFDRGAFTSRSTVSVFHFGLARFSVPPAPPSNYAHELARLPWPVAFLDLHAAAGDPQVARWLDAPHLSRDIDELYWARRLRERWITVDLPWPRLYDAILFVRRGSAARIRPGR